MRTRSFAFALVVSGLAAASAFADAQPLGIPAGAAVYIENMDPEFEQDFRAELTRQKVALTVVSSREEAQVLVVGAEQPKAVNLAQEQGRILMSVRRGGTVRVQDKANSTILWSGKWEVHSYDPKDQRKAASNLVGKLKKAVR